MTCFKDFFENDVEGVEPLKRPKITFVEAVIFLRRAVRALTKSVKWTSRNPKNYGPSFKSLLAIAVDFSPNQTEEFKRHLDAVSIALTYQTVSSMHTVRFSEEEMVDNIDLDSGHFTIFYMAEHNTDGTTGKVRLGLDWYSGTGTLYYQDIVVGTEPKPLFPGYSIVEPTDDLDCFWERLFIKDFELVDK